MLLPIQRRFLTGLCLCLLLSPAQVLSRSFGNFNGILQDQTGQPIANILIALLQKSTQEALPILTRSDAGGRIHVGNIETGSYQIFVKSSEYRSPEKSLFDVVPGKTTAVTLILQQLLQLEPSQQSNLSVKTLLRTTAERRLIFRHSPGAPTETSNSRGYGRFFEEAALEVYSNAGVDGDYFVFPGDSSRGTTTNFALVDSTWGNKYVLAGQLGSGEDSLWRLKNFVNLGADEAHSMQMFVGYSRLSFDQPSLSLLSNPTNLGDYPEYTRAAGTTKIVSLGFEENVMLSDALSVAWGLEMDQVQSHTRRTFLNPSAEVTFSPAKSTKIQVLMASKKTTHRNSVVLPDGDSVNLSDAVYFSRVGDEFNVGTSRHYQGSIAQKLNENTEIELAVYENRIDGGATPFLAVLEVRPQDAEVLHLDNQQADNSGYRVTLRRHLRDNLKAVVSYIRGNATGVDGQDSAGLRLGGLVPGMIVSRNKYNAISTAVEAYIPSSGTRVHALVKFVTNGDPITTLDAFSDVFETGNEGVNLVVRQTIPVPEGWLSFVGLDFLSAYQFEALIDVRNLTNEDLGKTPTPLGDVALVRSPRSVRGGISVRF